MNHNHQEAFKLMWYECEECSCRLQFWNSRDGVTPFTAVCPSCGALLAMRHVFWNKDVYAPDHQPWIGQPVWIDMTREQAEAYTEHRLKSHEIASESDRAEVAAALFKEIYHDGKAPDLILWGYRRDLSITSRPNWWPRKG